MVLPCFFYCFLFMIVIYAIFRRGVYVDFIYTIYSSYDITTLSVYVCIYIFMCIWISVHVLCNVSIFVCFFYCTFVLLSQQWLNKDVQSIYCCNGLYLMASRLVTLLPRYRIGRGHRWLYDGKHYMWLFVLSLYLYIILINNIHSYHDIST